MANIAFKKGLLAGLPSTYSEGTFYVTTDERGLYLDISGTERIRFGDFQEFATLAALKANSNPSQTALYYVSELNCLAKWNGADYIQINLDTGATSFEVAGDGNAVTAFSYDAATRKLTLTKGATFATADYVGSIPEGYTETNIVAYINKKAEETLNAASGGSSESAASVLAALTTYKSETDPRLDALEEKVGDKAVRTQIDEKIEALNLGETYDEKGSAAQVLIDAKAYADGKDVKIKEAQDAADAAQADVDALEKKIGTVADSKTIVQMIEDAKIAATYNDAQVKADIASNREAIYLLNDGASVAGSVDYKIAQAVAAIIENPDETMNSINELVMWCNDHAADALELSNKVSANEADITALEGLVGTTGVAAQIEVAIATALKVDGVDKYALAADLTAAIARIAALEAKAHEHTNKDVLDGITIEKVAAWDVSEQNAKDYADSLAGNYDTKGSATQALTDANAYADSLAKNYDAAGAATTAEDNAKAYADGLANNYDASGSAATAELNAKAYADSLVLTWGSF